VNAYIRDEFQKWCLAFHENSSITIYHHNDDVIRFCYALQSTINPSSHNIYDHCAAPWNPPPQSRPVQRRSIRVRSFRRTSHLADQIPAPTLLAIVLPLLKNRRDSTLYTANFVPLDKLPAEQKLKSLLYCDPLTMFVLLSCVPAEYVTGFCSGSSLHEATLGGTTNEGHECLWKFSWKRSSEGKQGECSIDTTTHSPVWETDTLVKILNDIYFSMFKNGIDSPPRFVSFSAQLQPRQFRCVVQVLDHSCQGRLECGRETSSRR
jgi:hypothetical protein